MNKFYPLSLRLTNKRVVIIGGGQVALSKAQTLLHCGAQITVISPQILPELRQLGRVTWLNKTYQPQDIADAHIIFAATNDPKVNLDIGGSVQDWQWFDDNGASGLANCCVPATASHGSITLAVSNNRGDCLQAEDTAQMLLSHLQQVCPADVDSLTIHATSVEDHQEIVNVWLASVRATHDFLTEDDISYLLPLVATQYLPAVDSYFMRNKQGAISGFIGIAQGKIEMLFVDPAARGSGVGKRLLQYAVNELGATEVDVNEQNPQAIGFYQHQGFVTVGRSETDGMGKPFPLLHMRFQPEL